MKPIIGALPALLMFGFFEQTPPKSTVQEKIGTIEIHAHRYAFSPSEITLEKGETAHLRLICDDVPHSLLVPGLKINQSCTKGHPSETTISPNSSGDFRGQCGRFCGSGHGSMRFTLHVKD